VHLPRLSYESHHHRLLSSGTLWLQARDTCGETVTTGGITVAMLGCMACGWSRLAQEACGFRGIGTRGLVDGYGYLVTGDSLTVPAFLKRALPSPCAALVFFRGSYC
jgi:hypothetical protein